MAKWRRHIAAAAFLIGSCRTGEISSENVCHYIKKFTNLALVHKLRQVNFMKIKSLLSTLVGLSCLFMVEATAQIGSSIGDSTSRTKVGTITHWSRDAKLFWSQGFGNWDNSSFADAELDTSKLVVPHATFYEVLALSTSFATYGFENEWSIAFGNLTHDDDLLVLDLGIGGLYGLIHETGVSNQVVPISYNSTSSGHPLTQGTATYNYSIHGTYVAANIPLMLEWRYGMKPVSLNVRVGIHYRIAYVTADRKFSTNGFPLDYDVSRNKGHFAYFNDYEMTESFDRKISQLFFAALPSMGISTRLPLTSQTGSDEGYGIIVGADFGAATRLYIAVSY